MGRITYSGDGFDVNDSAIGPLIGGIQPSHIADASIYVEHVPQTQKYLPSQKNIYKKMKENKRRGREKKGV